MELISLKNVQGSETNPFMLELQGKMYLQPRANAIIAKGQSIIDTTTGEILDDGVLIGRRKIVDKSQFAKIYASEIGQLYDLSKPAQNVFLHLTKIMDYDNKAIFNYQKEYQKLGYKTEVSPLKGLRELITRGIIAPHIVNNIYWLNPAIVCKGERFAKYTEYIIGKDGEEIKNEAMIKEQNRNLFNALPENTQHKMKKSGGIFPIDSNNNQSDL